MKSVIIITDNFFLSKGITEMLKLRKSTYVFYYVSCLDKIGDISRFDYIFLEIESSETNLCLFDMQNRKESSSLFFIQKGMFNKKSRVFLNCYKDTISFSKGLTIDNILKIIDEYQKRKETITCNRVNHCASCKYPYLTDVQLLILIGVKHGFSARELSLSLDISNKTVFSHISRIKNNFNLRGSLDLFNFMKNDLACYEPICRR